MAHIDVRRAIAGDGEAIARIYNHYVLTSTATFDTEPKTPADREAWLANRSPAHPVLVAEQDGRGVGWGSLSPWGERPAYRHSVEISTYVDFESIRDVVGAITPVPGGVGPLTNALLLSHLLRAATDQAERATAQTAAEVAK